MGNLQLGRACVHVSSIQASSYCCIISLLPDIERPCIAGHFGFVWQKCLQLCTVGTLVDHEMQYTLNAFNVSSDLACAEKTAML